MRYVLFVLSVLTGFIGLVWFAAAKTSIHEIQAAVLFLIAAVLLAGSAIVSAVDRLRRDVLAQRPPNP